MKIMTRMSEQKIIQGENTIHEIEKFIQKTLKNNGYTPFENTPIYWDGKNDNYGFVFIPLNHSEVRDAWNTGMIDDDVKNIEEAIYATAFIPSPELSAQMRSIDGVKTKNEVVLGIKTDKRFISIYTGDNYRETGTDTILPSDYLYLPISQDKDGIGLYLELGIIDKENVYPVFSLKDAKTVESLIKHPMLIKATETISHAENRYNEIIPIMESIAHKEMNKYHDGEENLSMKGAITAHVPDGRQIVVKPSIFRCNERGILEIDGNVYIETRVITPYFDGTVDLRPLDEVPAYWKKTTKDTISIDVPQLIEELKDDFKLKSETLFPYSLLSTASANVYV
jgi:hypothetical protein